MSFLAPVSRRELEENGDATTHVAPSEHNVWVAGAPGVTKIAPRRAISPSPVRFTHQGEHDGSSVHLYFQYSPLPVGLSSSRMPASVGTQHAAMDELKRYSADIVEPMICQRVDGTQPTNGAIYESTTRYMSNATVENIATNMISHGLCLQCTVTDPMLSFQSFTTKITGEDLQNCSQHAQPIMSGGFKSKFIKTTSNVAPHSVLLHIIENPQDSTSHLFYGVSFKHMDKF